MMSFLSLYIFVTLFTPIFTNEVAPKQTCDVVNSRGSLRPGGVHYSTKECSQFQTCKKNFKMTYIIHPPYYIANDTTRSGLHNLLQKCCGPCVQHDTHELKNMSELTWSAIRDADMVYPILSTSHTKKLYGFWYLPWDGPPSFMYITKTDHSLLEGFICVYPVVIILVLLALLSGFVAWILETWNNTGQFPKSFFIGWLDGVWWSFVSMTTVGYGDRVPKSLAGRLYSVIWIIIGIVGFGILTGHMTGEIVKANNPSPPSMDRKKVGVLKYREFDSFVISRSGGMVKRNQNVTDFNSDVKSLIDKLMNDKIDGFLLDLWTLAYLDGLAEKVLRKDQLEFFINATMRTEKQYNGPDLSYGILFKEEHDFDYFHDFAHDSHLRTLILSTERWVTVKHSRWRRGNYFNAGHSKLFSTSEPSFQLTVTTIAIMIGIILLFGVIYEVKRRWTSLKDEYLRGVFYDL